MAIPRRISFLEESRSRGMINLHSSGSEEYEIYSSGSSGNFEEWVIAKILKIPQKFKKILKKISKKNFSIEFIFYSSECLVILPKSDQLSWKTEIKTEKSWQIAENFLIFSFFYIFKCLQRKFSIFQVLGKFWQGLEEPRSCKIYSSGNRGVKKGPGPRGSRDEEFLVPSIP